MIKTIRIDLSEEHTLVMKVKMFDEEEEVSIERLLRIDMANLALEVVTFPVLINQISLLMADINFKVNVEKLQLEKFEGELGEKLRADHLSTDTKALSNERVSEKISKHPKYVLLKTRYFQRVREQEEINGLYWAMKSKDEKLTSIAKSLQAGDVVESVINNRLKKFNYLDMKVLQTNNKEV